VIRKQLTNEQALQKLRQYCAYQERCHHEVRQKLWDLGVRKQDHDTLISTLIEENYLDEERFAIQFAGGKFRMLQWGKKKILYALREKKVSEYSISKALKLIDQEHYLQTVMKLALEKYDSLKKEQHLVRKKKTQDYLLQKGYESEVVADVLRQIVSKE
jgi:regulatory protein